MFGQSGNTSFSKWNELRFSPFAPVRKSSYNPITFVGGFNTATQSSPFGQSAFGKPITTTSFGTGAAPVFGSSNTSIFSSKPAGSTTGGLFSSTTTPPAFTQPSFGGSDYIILPVLLARPFINFKAFIHLNIYRVHVTVVKYLSCLIFVSYPLLIFKYETMKVPRDLSFIISAYFSRSTIRSNLICGKKNIEQQGVVIKFSFLQGLVQQIQIPIYLALNKMQVQIFLVQILQHQHLVNRTNQLDLVLALHLVQVYLDNLNNQLNKLLLLDKAVPLEMQLYLVQRLVRYVNCDKQELFCYFLPFFPF